MLWASSRCFFIRVVDPSTQGTHVISPAFGTLSTDPMIRTRRQPVVLPQPGVGRFGTAGMNCTLGRTVLTEACMFRSLRFFDAGGSLTCAIDSKFFCFRIMNRSIRTQAKPSRHTII